MNEAKAKAEAHWQWLESWLHKSFVDAFVHGFKHAMQEQMKESIIREPEEVKDNGTADA